jgi:DNA polymerase-1
MADDRPGGELVRVSASRSRPRLFLVDGYALVYRAFHAVGNRPLTTSRGENTSIPWGIANFLERLRRTHQPEYLGWVHDAGTSEREERYAAYKATRVALEPTQQADFDRGVERVGAILAAQRTPLLLLPGFEADDVIATLARQAAAAGTDVVIVSPDKDLLQLVRPGVSVLNPYHGKPGATTEKWYDETNARERLGVPPERVADYLALVGDASDNIPGVAGIGDKGARQLIEQWGTIENMLEHLDQVTPARAQNALRAHEAEARLSKELVTVREDLPITLDLGSLTVEPPDVASLRALYVELEFNVLARSLPAAKPVEEVERAAAYHLVDTIPALDALIDHIRAAGQFAMHVEPELEPGAPPVLTALRATAAGISVALQAGEAFYLPLAHRGPGGQSTLALEAAAPEAPRNLPPFDDARMRPLVALLEDSGIRKIAHNAKFDTLVLRRLGIALQGVTFDTMLASYLVDPGRRSHAADVLAFDVLHHTMTSLEAVRGKGRAAVPFGEVKIEAARDYACEYVDYVLRLHAHFALQLAEHGLSPLLDDLELPLATVLAEMEWIGVGIDLAWFASLKERFQREREASERRIWDVAGEEFNINSNARLREILFERLGLPVRKRTATGPSTDASVLQDLAEEGHALPVLLMEYRELAKLESTYLDALPALVNPRTGRLHTSYSQTVAATGRLSSSDPNLQNIPVRTSVGRDIRRGFVPRAGWLFLAADYSQIELRLLAHLSGDPLFVEAFRADGDIHRQTAALVFDVPVDAVTSEMRARAKTINFATIYGQGAFSLSRQLRIELDEAKRFIATYFERFAGVRQFLDACVQRARERGYAETLFGRRRYIPELRDRNFNVRSFGERVAQNSPIQGSAADLIKRAMLRVAAALQRGRLEARLLLQVHDELVLESPPGEIPALRTLVADAMEHAADLAVPLVVDIGTGPNWLETKAG